MNTPYTGWSTSALYIVLHLTNMNVPYTAERLENVALDGAAFRLQETSADHETCSEAELLLWSTGGMRYCGANRRPRIQPTVLGVARRARCCV